MSRLRRFWLNRTWRLRNVISEVIYAIKVARIHPCDIERPQVGDGEVVLTENDWYGALERISVARPAEGMLWAILIDRWPENARMAAGLAPAYARTNRDEIILMDGDMRDVVLGLVEEWLKALDARPPQRDDELVEALDDLNALMEPHRRGVAEA